MEVGSRDQATLSHHVLFYRVRQLRWSVFPHLSSAPAAAQHPAVCCGHVPKNCCAGAQFCQALLVLLTWR